MTALRFALLCGLVMGCSASSKSPPAAGAEDAEVGMGDAAAPVDASSGGDNFVADAGLASEARACPAVNDADNAGPIGPKSLSEASGLVASRKNADVLWLHNDSGDKPRIFATRANGVALTQVALTGADALDWEDIALGPGPKAGASYLYLGDIGDNERKRARVQIYRVEEPGLNAAGEAPSQSITADRIDVTFEDGAHDAETLLIDPVSGDLYIVEKALMASGVYRVPRPANGDSKVTAKRVASISLLMSTGGDVLPDGAGLAIRTYAGVSYWPRDPALPLENAFKNEPCALKLALEPQGEAVGFFADGSGYYTVSEGEGAILHAYRFK